MFWNKNRFNVVQKFQHLYNHPLSDFLYTNPALPGVTNVESALNYILAVLYPATKTNVATPAALPGAGNTIGDYRVVDDDGDGKSAGYRWEQREGDVSPSWHKVFDVDWSTDAILAAVTDVTDDKYMYSKGKSDLDASGALVVGLYAGQKVYGGALAGENLTLNANSGDGVGAQTGFVQIDSQFRPTLDDTFDLSTATERWKDLYLSNSAIVDTMTIASGSITDSSGTIDFGDEILNTTGNISGAQVKGTSLVADDTVDTMTLVSGSITDTTGAISFGAANLSTSGTLGAGVTTLTGTGQTLILDPNDGGGKSTILSTLGIINFGDENLETTGTLNAGAGTFTQVNADNLRLDGNTLSSTDVDGNINLLPNGTGVVDVQKAMQTLDITATGTVGVTGQLDADNLRLDGNTISSTDIDGDIVLSPDGTGIISFTKDLVPSGDNARDIGTTLLTIKDLFMKGSIGDGTNAITSAALLSLRHALFRDAAETLPAQAGDALFYNGSVWLASVPDTEVDHGTISGLLDDDHTQYALLAGRAGGQILQGGVNASDNLVLDSTAHATKGSVLLRSILAPETDASFSGSWTGTDIGDATHNFRDFYSKGEFKGFRLENFTTGTLPAASAQNIGRVLYNTTTSKAMFDTGTAIKVLSVSKFVGDQAFNGSDLTKDVTVSSDITDARNAQWQLLDNANDFEILYVKLQAIDAATVRITTTIPLPAGSYRLIGIE